MAASQASLLLQKQLKDLCKKPVDGFSAGLVDENNVFEWSVSIMGPPDTLYEGGFFSAIMSFPQNYPLSPPTVRFTTEVWHPNVYPDGKVCISILHPPGDDPNGYELATERWSPVHTPFCSSELLIVSWMRMSDRRDMHMCILLMGNCKDRKLEITAGLKCISPYERGLGVGVP
ncbi:ubiquitin-conjugating enzyme E2 14 isoform X2 [Manihot esculenta]|uniref:UBC core domain-containing protein n=1 Tax=Manihot esculenta TaxID=3983 RepID=A0A2C9VKG9_MANES|nr:ubiquitin-conjugating enzyme E2 14 isoform X2 [Manihot esculenta]OAY46066.1 hypothetical protein MANES_07G113900v8 [Manihot esculenta]